MKKYTTIQNSLTSKLNSADTYRFACLSFTPRKDGYTDSTFKQIGEYVNKDKPESENTIKDFVKRLKDSQVIQIDETWIDGKRRNKFFINNPETGFIIIKKELLELDLAVELKGFMIQLFSLTINSTFECNYSLNKIVTLIKVSKPTAQKYLAVLVEKGYIIKTATGYKLSNDYFSIGNRKSKQILEIYKSIQGCEHLTNRYLKTDWNNINDPAKYWRDVVGGCAGMKKDKQVINEVILI